MLKVIPCYNPALVQGLYALTLAVCLTTASAQPILPPLVPGLAPGVTIALTSAGLVTTGAAFTNTVPLVGVALAGGAVAVGAFDKALLIKGFIDEVNKNNANSRR